MGRGFRSGTLSAGLGNRHAGHSSTRPRTQVLDHSPRPWMAGLPLRRQVVQVLYRRSGVAAFSTSGRLTGACPPRIPIGAGVGPAGPILNGSDRGHSRPVRHDDCGQAESVPLRNPLPIVPAFAGWRLFGGGFQATNGTRSVKHRQPASAYAPRMTEPGCHTNHAGCAGDKGAEPPEPDQEGCFYSQEKCFEFEVLVACGPASVRAGA